MNYIIIEKEYTNPETGYMGVMYGKSSLSVFDKNGKEVMHTGSRNINTYNELVYFVDTFDEFLKILAKTTFKENTERENKNDD